MPLSLSILIFESPVFVFAFFFSIFVRFGEEKNLEKPAGKKVVRSRDVDWYNRSIIDENNKVEWTSNMAGSSPQVLKQAFHETYELKEELGK